MEIRFLGGFCIPQAAFNELHVSLVGHRLCGTARSLLDGLHGPLCDGNVPSFCTYVLTCWPDVISQSILVELILSRGNVYVEDSFIVHSIDCV